MNYRKEARNVTQKLYGGYCEMCRKHDFEIIPYHKFSVKVHNELKKLISQSAAKPTE